MADPMHPKNEVTLITKKWIDMAYNEQLANRTREIISATHKITDEKAATAPVGVFTDRKVPWVVIDRTPKISIKRQ
jgi:hypothetical protein